MQNELSPMQNQESFTDLTLDGAQVYLANVCGKSLTPDARLALNVKKKHQIIYSFDHLEIIKYKRQVIHKIIK